MRGGRQSRRDRWFGLEEKSDFADFKRWWHREGKDDAGGTDINGRREAEQVYADWVCRGRPVAK